MAYPCDRLRLLKDAVQDSTWGRRYEQVLGALLCLCGSKLRAELEKQTHLATLLGTVAERVRQAGGSTRQVCVFVALSSRCFLFCMCVWSYWCRYCVAAGGAAGGSRKHPEFFPEKQLPTSSEPQSGGKRAKLQSRSLNNYSKIFFMIILKLVC